MKGWMCNVVCVQASPHLTSCPSLLRYSWWSYRYCQTDPGCDRGQLSGELCLFGCLAPKQLLLQLYYSCSMHLWNVGGLTSTFCLHTIIPLVNPIHLWCAKPRTWHLCLQGEEAKVIILSTTRNNKSGSIGFLKMRNRINVMLSRVGFLLDLKLGWCDPTVSL